MKKIFLIISSLALLMFVSCKSEFQDLNTNPELLVTTDPIYAFTGATENFNNSSRSHLTAKYSGVMRLMQYIVANGGASEGNYANPTKATNPSPYVPYYGDYYGQIGLKLNYLITTLVPLKSDKERYENLVAISKILQTYEAWLMFDVYGAAPYSEAFKGASEGIKTPVYDYFDDVYKSFDSDIKNSVETLLNSSTNQYSLGVNDYFYGGDVAKWIKFGNSLRIKIAQRLEKADNAFYTSVINEVLANAGGLISSNDESCVYKHPNEYNNNTDDMQGLTTNYCAARSFVEFLKIYNDPRLPILVRRNGFGQGNNNSTNDAWADTLAKYYPSYATDFPQWTVRYVGMAANPDSSSSTYSQTAYYQLKKGSIDASFTIRHNSQIESRFYVKNGGTVNNTLGVREKEDEKYNVSSTDISLFTPLITYPEVCFMMAEISLKAGAAKGGKDANTWYHDGIQASMEQYQTWAENMKVPSAMDATSDNYLPITSAKITAYLAQPEFATATLEKIATQQWINLFMRPEEAWANWKRTGFPSFKPQPVPAGGCAYFEELKSGGDQLYIPRRCALGAPNSANNANYEAAVQKLTSDSNYGASVNKTEGRIWWDKP